MLLYPSQLFECIIFFYSQNTSLDMGIWLLAAVMEVTVQTDWTCIHTQINCIEKHFSEERKHNFERRSSLYFQRSLLRTNWTTNLSSVSCLCSLKLLVSTHFIFLWCFSPSRLPWPSTIVRLFPSLRSL